MDGLAPTEARVLEALLRARGQISGRALGRITGLTQSSVQRALVKLRSAGLILAESAPPAHLYRANPEHLAMPALTALLHLDEQLRFRMGEQIAGWAVPPLSVVVFGSVARREAKPGSDLDVLVVRPDAVAPDDADWEHQVAELADRLQAWTGRPASVMDLDRSELADGLANSEPFLVAAEREGWLIAGRALGHLLDPPR
jgi:predicted nucleotidyltransferase/biotin operon repressor